MDKTTVAIHGQQWDVVPVRPSALTIYRKGQEPERLHGDCIVPERPRSRLSRKERRIRIDKTLDEKTLLETLIHEFLHAANPDKNEEWIEDPAEELTELLWKFGYRRSE